MQNQIRTDRLQQQRKDSSHHKQTIEIEESKSTSIQDGTNLLHSGINKPKPSDVFLSSKFEYLLSSTRVEKWTEEQILQFVNELTDDDLKPVVKNRRDTTFYMASSASFVFRNLMYQDPNTQDFLIRGVSGALTPGTTCAVIGAPDAHVTELFQILTGRVRKDMFSGEILVNGIPPQSDFHRTVGFVPVVDTHIPTLTVAETLMMAVELRLPQWIPLVMKKLRVLIVLKRFGLLHVKDTIVGSESLRGISGGERRRLSIAVEAIVGHSIIFCDLPTNGLDSATAYNLLKFCGDVAHDLGLVICCSMVQASSEMLERFDNCMVMSKGASLYFGPMAEVSTYFHNLGYGPSKPGMTNSEFLEHLSADPRNVSLVGHQEDDFRKVWLSMVQAFRKSSYSKQIGDVFWTEMDKYISVASEKEYGSPRGIEDILQVNDNNEHSEYAAPFRKQLAVLIWREFTVIYRERAQWVSRFVRCIVLAIVLGTLFYDLKPSASDVSSTFGVIVISVSFFAFDAASAIPNFAQSRAVFYQQKQARYYRPLAFWISKQVIELPQIFLEAFLFSVIMYSLTALTGGIGSSQFWFYYILLVFVSIACKSFAGFLASVMPDPSSAQGFCAVILTVFFFMCGFMVKKTSIPAGWSWVWYISPLAYGFKGLAINQWYSVDSITCSDGYYYPLRTDPLYSVPAPDGFGGFQSCIYQTGKLLLQSYDISVGSESEKFLELVWLLLFACVTSCLMILGLNMVDWSAPGSPFSFSLAQLRKKTFWKNTQFHHLNPKTIPRKHKKDMLELRDDEIFAVEVAPSISNQKALVWNNLNYTVKSKHGEKQLLKDVYGYAKPGVLVALVGASGAGKSTLLDVLAGRKTGGHIDGSISFGGKEKKSGKGLDGLEGYVEQFESHHEFSTVREVIRFSGELRSKTKYSSIDEQVNNIIQTLGLENVADSMIGNPSLGGLTLEQRKKASIGVELIADPEILFLDEPTTGLDSIAAVRVMETVLSLSKTRSVVCTIHQPSAEIVNMIDYLLIMQNGGKVAFFGAREDVPKFFTSVGLAEYQDGKNLADFALEAIKQAQLEKMLDPSELFKNSEFFAKVNEELENSTSASEVEEKNDHIPKRKSASYLRQLLLHLVREWRGNIRDIPTFATKIGATLFTAFMIGTLYSNLSLDQTGASSRISVIFASLTFPLFFCNVMGPLVVKARPVLNRERFSNMYSESTYFFGRLLAEMPLTLVLSTVFSIIVYWSVGFQKDASKFLFFLAEFIIMSLNANFIGQLIATIAPTEATAAIGIVSAIPLSMVFAGFLIPKASIPDAWVWVFWGIFSHYQLFFLSANELEGLQFSCPNNTGAVPVFVGYGNSTCTATIDYTNSYCWRASCPITSGDASLAMYSISATDKWQYLFVSIGIMAGFGFLLFCAFHKIKHLNR